MKLLNYQKDPNAPEKPTVAEQDTIRIVIGLLGFFLPIILWLGLWIYSGHTRPLNSISHYYYSRVSSAFAITMGVLAIVLFVYKGKLLIDFILSAVAAVSALLVVIFPTNIGYKTVAELPIYFVTFIEENKLRSVVHFTAAGIFLSCLALMSLVRFPRNDSSDEQPKPLDKFMYRLCGVVMLLALGIVFLGANGILLPNEWFNEKESTGIFWGETVAVCFFGYSWLLKAGFFGSTVKRITNWVS